LPEARVTGRRAARGRAAGKPKQPALKSCAACRAPVSDAGGIAERVRRERAAQGFPEKVEDPATITNVVTLAFEGMATPSRRP
jgi:hypothetical protein